MINKISFSKEWITEKAAGIGKHADRKLMEKVILAFALVEQLSVARLPYIFKGGTALLLLAGDHPQRYSIDVDIITEISPEELPVLDVLFSKSPYANLQTYQMNQPWISLTDEVINVIVPDHSSLAGDKLTAFAPTTIGILYSKNRPAEIMKQLFDLGYLFHYLEDLDAVRESYIKTAEEEIRYRNLFIGWKDTLKDTFDTCLILTYRDETNERFRHLLNGNKRLANFILQTYSLDHAIVSAAKTAYLTQLILQGSGRVMTYENPTQVTNLTLTQPNYSKIARLKKSNPEAFFYWYHALQLLPLPTASI